MDETDVVAGRDVKRLCDGGASTPIGERQGRDHVAGRKLSAIPARPRAATCALDPYEMIRKAASDGFPPPRG